MEIKLYYTGKDSHKIKKEIEKFYSEVKKYFDFDLDELNVHIHKTRKDFDKYLNKKTELWNVANANSRSNRINILHPEAFEKESSHPKDDFPATLKHEIAHLFIGKLSQNKAVPKWLDEGMAYYIANQYSKVSNSGCFIEEGFCEILATPRGWRLFLNYNAYRISSLFVYYLIKTFSFDKTKELVLSLDKNYYYPFFQEKFKKIFEMEIKDIERDFVKDANIGDVI